MPANDKPATRRSEKSALKKNEQQSQVLDAGNSCLLNSMRLNHLTNLQIQLLSI